MGDEGKAVGLRAAEGFAVCSQPREGQENSSFLPFIIDKLRFEMSDDGEIQPFLTKGGPSCFDMDEAFCARMSMAIEAGLESAPIGVVITPGTKNPRYVAAKPRPQVSSQRYMEHA
jgi:hypothetical protein